MLVGLRHLPAVFRRALFALVVVLAVGLVTCTAAIAAPKAGTVGEC